MKLDELKLVFSRIMLFGCLVLVLVAVCSCENLNLNPCDHEYSKEYTMTEGFHYIVCTKCGDRQKGSYDIHKFGSMSTDIAATEESCGSGSYTCHVCGYVKRVVIHNYVLIEEIQPTCAGNGMSAHYECSTCDGLFDMNYREANAKDFVKNSLSHSSMNLDNIDFISMPTFESGGLLKFRCDNFESCGGYVYFGGSSEIRLPPITEENYFKTYGDDNLVGYQIKSEYLDDLLSDRISYSGYRERVVMAASAFTIVMDVCTVDGHKFTPTSFVNDNNTLYYVCENDANHTLDISLPEIGSEDFSDGNHISATCTMGAGTVYRLNCGWREVISKYEGDLVYEGYTLNDYSSALYQNFRFFVLDEGAEPNPDNHPDSTIIIKDYYTPKFDAHTLEYSDGKATCFCTDCNTTFTETIEYKDGSWRYAGSLLNSVYYRDYRVFGQTVSSPKVTAFKYRIDGNGGVTADGEEYILGEIDNGFFILFSYNFTKEDSKLIGISINVDRGTGTVKEGRVEEHLDQWSLIHGSYDYWIIKMNEEHMGDIIVTLHWTYVS